MEVAARDFDERIFHPEDLVSSEKRKTPHLNTASRSKRKCEPYGTTASNAVSNRLTTLFEMSKVSLRAGSHGTDYRDRVKAEERPQRKSGLREQIDRDLIV